MKQIFTLFALCLLSVAVNAQLTEKFENYSSLSSACWQLSGTQQITTSQVMEGASSIASINTDPAIISTPYLDFTGTSVISFNYRLNNKLNNLSARQIEVGTTDKNGTFVAAASIELDKNTSHTDVFSFSRSLPFTAGTKRFTIRILSNQGDGNTHVILDNLSVSAVSLHYNPQTCNTPPVATNAFFASPGYMPFNGNLAVYASDANAGETLTFSMGSLLTNYGTLVVNPNGTFQFTPNGNYSGGEIRFTYSVTDNGYDPMGSNLATVTITYPARIVLPVQLASFTGSVASPKAHLLWSVTQNEDGETFEVEKSSDGKRFTTAALVMTTQKAGAEQYRFTDASFKGTAYYRLKIMHKNATATYSKTIVLTEKSENHQNSLALLQNPVTSSIRFTYQAATAGTANVSLYTASGVKMFSTRINVQSGLTQTTLASDGNIAPGAYILEVVNGTERSITKLVKL